MGGGARLDADGGYTRSGAFASTTSEQYTPRQNSWVGARLLLPCCWVHTYVLQQLCSLLLLSLSPALLFCLFSLSLFLNRGLRLQLEHEKKTPALLGHVSIPCYTDTTLFLNGLFRRYAAVVAVCKVDMHRCTPDATLSPCTFSTPAALALSSTASRSGSCF